MRDWRWLIGAGGGIALMLGLLGFAAHFRDEERTFRATAQRAIGTVVGYTQSHERDHNGRPKSSAFDVIEFRTAGGELVQFTAANTELRPRREIGATGPILYQSTEPKKARIDDDSAEYGARVITGLSPLGLVMTGIFVFVWARSRRPALRERQPAIGSSL